MASDGTGGRGGDALARFLLDPMRAGLQVAGASSLSLAFAFAAFKSSGDAGPFAWLGLTSLSVIVVAIFGYPGPRPGFIAFVGRSVGASLWAGAFMTGFVLLVLTKAHDVDTSIFWRLFLVLFGAAVIAIGIWPRRRVAAIVPSRVESVIARDIGIALMVVGAAAFAGIGIAVKVDWIAAALRGSRRAPDGVALVLGASIGFAIVAMIASSVWMLRRRAAHPWVFALLPSSVLVAIGLAVDRMHMRPVLASALATSSPLDDRVSSITTAIDFAWPVWVTMLIVVAKLTSASSLVLGIRARVRAPAASTAGARPVLTLALGLLTVAVIAVAVPALFGRKIGNSAIFATWLALVPSAVAVAALFLSARGGAAFAGDALNAAVLAALSVLAIAFAESTQLLSVLDDSMTTANKVQFGTYVATDMRAYVLACLPALAPIVVAVVCAVSPRDLGAGVARAFPFAGSAALTLGLGFASLHVATRAPMTLLGSLWAREKPAALALINARGDACDGLITSDIVFIGPQSIARAGREIAPTSQLDTDAGCASFVIDLERGFKPPTDLRIAVDPSIAYARIECLTRALGSATLRDEKNARVVRRKPRCSIEAVVASETPREMPQFPECTALRIAGAECNAPKDAEIAIATATSLFRRTDANVSVAPLGAPDADGARYGVPPLFLSADGATRFADLLSLPQRTLTTRSMGNAQTMRETWLVAADRPSPAMQATLAPPRFDVMETAGGSVNSVASDADALGTRAVVGIETYHRLVACQAFGSGNPATRSGGSRFALLVAPDGTVTNVWTEALAGGPVVGACMSKVASELRFNARPDASVVFIDVGMRILRASVSLSDVDDGAGSVARQRDTEAALRKAADGPVRDCYETGLRASAGKLTGDIRARLQVSRLGKVTFAFAGRPFDEKVVNCALDALRAATMPANPPGDYEVHATFKLSPPGVTR